MPEKCPDVVIKVDKLTYATAIQNVNKHQKVIKVSVELCYGKLLVEQDTVSPKGIFWEYNERSRATKIHVY